MAKLLFVAEADVKMMNDVVLRKLEQAGHEVQYQVAYAPEDQDAAVAILRNDPAIDGVVLNNLVMLDLNARHPEDFAARIDEAAKGRPVIVYDQKLASDVKYELPEAMRTRVINKIDRGGIDRLVNGMHIALKENAAGRTAGGA